MSSSFVVESHQSGSKKDDTLIIVVNDDGTISVDQETLQNLIMNQADAKVSVVRVGQSEGDAESGDLTLTVDPPTFERNEAENAPASVAAPTDVAGLVDPFMEMDPEQLEKLETALQSEQAKQILGENVTAMLDMLTVEEQQKSIKYCIELDHCYTSRTSPADPEPSDPLPVANSPDIVDDLEQKNLSQQAPTAIVPSVEASIGDGSSTTPVRSKTLPRSTVTRSAVGRGRKIAAPVVQPTSGAKTPPALSPRSSSTLIQQSPNKGVSTSMRVEAERKENDSSSSSSESSSESEPPSDDDSDFGPRGPRRGGIRARGGRKGLTTRGGGASATRRRSANKQMDMDQVRRLDMEMAAAVVAMKSPEKSERPERFNPVRAKKRTKSTSGRKKEDSSPNRATNPSTNLTARLSPTIPEPPPVVENTLQTTNQVKANLINANMIKGDMILTKPGQARNNQKVLFVQKKVMVRPNEMKTFGIKRQSLILEKSGKTMPLNVQTNIATSDDGKLATPSGKNLQATIENPKEPKTPTITSPATVVSASASSTSPSSIITLEQQQQPPRIDTPPSQLPQQLFQHEQTTPETSRETIPTPSPPLRAKTTEVRREKKKSESEIKDESSKSSDIKTPDVSKKHLKREPRKAPAILADTLGPALFSTPDIIRRVGSDAKSSDSPGTPVSQAPSFQNSTVTSPDFAASPLTTVKRQDQTSSGIAGPETMESTESLVAPQIENESSSQVKSDEVKSDSKAPTVEELEPSLDPAATPIADNPELVRSAEAPVPNEIIPEQSGIEGEEHLLATLEMEASKHDEELLAEALLLQEELGVDLADHPVLSEPTATIPEPLLSTSATFEAPMETSEGRPEVSMKADETLKTVETADIAPALATEKISSSILETPKKKDEKEPIQIIRGGRVITLPPIEAPATRSKRLQGKPGTPQKSIEPPKKDEKIIKPPVQKMKDLEETVTESENIVHDINDEEDDDDEEDEDNSDSEDDPDRLWCICKRPHNNRFMICCDVCEDWFHGKCVHVSKAMGQQMEEKGIEWVCPNCTKKKDQSATSSEQRKPQPLPPKQQPLPVKIESDRSPRAAVAPRASVPASEKVRKAPSQPALFEMPAVIPTSLAGVTQCVVCKKEARNSSIYCSDACILTHAQETLTRDNKPSVPTKVAQDSSDAPLKTTTDPRVIVFERRTGKVLTGADAPTRSNLKTWLKENPTFEVVRPKNLNTLQIGGKTVTAIQTQGVGKIMKPAQGAASSTPSKMVYTKVLGSKQTVLAPSNKKLVVLSGGQQRLSPKTIQQKSQGSPSAGKSPNMRQTTIKIVTPRGKSPTTIGQKQAIPKKQEVGKVPSTSQQPQQHQDQQQKAVQKTPPAKRAEPEPIRLNVRKILAELLTTRIRDTKDLTLSDEEISALALNIELELYKYFRDTGAKYKSKYRSLVFNIKDPKNLTLFRKIADRSLTPDAVVRLSPDEMASQELAEWREKETKHQLEMIKKNELDLMSQAKSIVVKTHKGELIIENDSGIDRVDPKTPVQDIVTVLNSHEGVTEDNNDDIGKPGHSLSSEDSKWSKANVSIDANTSVGEERKKRDKDRSRDKDRGEGKRATRSMEKDSEKSTRPKRLDDDEAEEAGDERRRSRSRGRSRRSRDRERSRDRKSTRSKESKRNGERDGKDRERHKSGKESRQRDKERDRRSRGKNKDRKSRSSRDEDGRGGRRDPGDKRGDASGQQTGNAEDAKPIEDRLWRHIEEETTTSTIVPTVPTSNAATFDGNDSDLSDREPSSTVNIKTPDINDDPEREKETGPASIIGESSQLSKQQNSQKAGQSQTVWRGFVNMVDVAKFFITAQEVSGQARDLMDDLPDTVDVVGRISHETVWDYITKMKRTGSKEILVIRLTAANDEEKIPYITLYSYLNSRSRLGVVGNVSKNIKDFYIMPFSRQSQIPSVLLPLVGPGFEDQRPHLLLGIIVRNKRKRVSNVSSPITGPPAKLMKKDDDVSSVDKNNPSVRHQTPHHHHHHHHHHHQQLQQSPPGSPRPMHKGLLLESLRDKQANVTQMTLESLNKAHVGMSRSAIIDNATISKLVPELSSKIDLSQSPKVETPPPLTLSPSAGASNPPGFIGDDDDGDEPYSPGGATDVDDADDELPLPKSNLLDVTAASILSPTKNSTELQRKMDELNRQIEEQKQQIQSISSSFLGDAASTLPGLGLDPPEAGDSDEAYSPTDTRSFTPPPPGIAKFAQPILDKVSDITIPANLQEILANVKRQESSKIDPYLPSKPSATFLTTSNSPLYPVKTTEKYTPTFISKNTTTTPQSPIDNSSSSSSPSLSTSSASVKETKSTLRSLSDLDLIKKAEEELAAVAAATEAAAAAAISTPTIFPKIDSVPTPPPSFSSPPPPLPPPPLPPSKPQNVELLVEAASPEVPDKTSDKTSDNEAYVPSNVAECEKNSPGSNLSSLDQPKPPGLEDEELPPIFPASNPPTILPGAKTPQKFVPKSGVVLCVKRKVNDDGASSTAPIKAPRTKSRWGQGPTE